MHLPISASERKRTPLWSGLFKYFPDALVAVAQLSQIGNEQHNPGQPLHWAREKSKDHEDTLLRHIMDSGSTDSDGVRHTTKVAWRALAMLQTEIENDETNTEAEPLPVTFGSSYVSKITPNAAGPEWYFSGHTNSNSGGLVVRTEVPWALNSQRGEVQPGFTNSSFAATPVWDDRQADLPFDGFINCS